MKGQSVGMTTWGRLSHLVSGLVSTLAARTGQLQQLRCDCEQLTTSSKTNIERGNSVINEVTHIYRTQELGQVTDIWDMSQELEVNLGQFTTRLEALRDRIENTAKCYQLLDKAYEWAVGAMQHISALKLPEGSAHVSDLDTLLTSLELYLNQHPVLPVAVFDRMLAISKNLCNDKLHQQCVIAKERCLETQQLLKTRKETLCKARDQALLLDRSHGSKGKFRRSIACSVSNENGLVFDAEPVVRRKDKKKGTKFEGHPSRISNSPVDSLMSVLRRRSYAGKPSTPMYSPMVAAFKENARDMNLDEYEQYLFNEGLITEDMSDRIVTCLPKGLADVKSRDALHSSFENLSGSLDSLLGDDEDTPQTFCVNKSKTLDSSDRSGSVSAMRDHSDVALRLGLAQSRRSASRRAQSGMVPGRGRPESWKTLSMLTASTESLPCTPEEDEALDTSIPPPPASCPWRPMPTSPLLGSDFHSMTDLRVTEQDIKRRRTLSLIMKEMIETETHYISSLQLVIDNYLPLMTSSSLPQPLRGKRHVIFGNIEKIYDFHRQFFQAELEQCENNPYHIGHIFMNHAPEFYLYALYNKNKPKSDAIMADYGKAFFKSKQTELQDHLDLSSYLLKPVQRMGKYALLLKQVLQQCEENHPDYADLKAAVDMVRFQLRHGNDLLAMDSLRGCDVNLSEQGMLLRQEEFLVHHGRRRRYRRVFLFEDLIVLSKTRRASNMDEVYSYKTSIRTSELGLTENVGDSGCKFEVWFRKRQQAGTYVMQAASREVHNSWVSDISRLLWKQAIRNRERHKAESVHMGMGAKPGLDLQPSQNNISDRLVPHTAPSTAPCSSTPHHTASVPERLHSNAFKWRPHSMISVSSSASSSSSGYHSQHSGGSPQYTGVKAATRSPLTGTEVETSPISVQVGESYLANLSISSPESGREESVSGDAFTQTTLRRNTEEVSEV